jgi:hypothetical protein
MSDMLNNLSPLLRDILDLLEKRAREEGAAAAVEMQQMIEMLEVMHCARMGNRPDAQFVAEAMHHHVSQILDQVFADEESTITGTLMRFQ